MKESLVTFFLKQVPLMQAISVAVKDAKKRLTSSTSLGTQSLNGPPAFRGLVPHIAEAIMQAAFAALPELHRPR